MKIQISLSTLTMTESARLGRAKMLGFDISKIWWHGGFKNFKKFDARRSGSGTFNFASDKNFAESYTRTRSQDEEGDYDIVVRPFFLPKNLFDYRNKEHLQQLEHVLPDSIKIQSNYGWGSWGGPTEYSKEELTDAIQGIDIPHTGLDDQAKEDIRSGKEKFHRDGGIDYVINFDPRTETVEYAPSYIVEAIRGLKSNIAFLEKEYPKEQYPTQDFQNFQNKQKLSRLEKEFKTYTLQFNPPKHPGYDNWEILESKEIRRYIQKLGFKGCVMQERKHETCCIFDNRFIRSIDATFDTKFKNGSILTS